ncbi:hypothetical protein SMD22_00195 (plasmid) [Brevibacillus halotolerans]|nr:hypothetical protein SMD22_00195 [Brevibacillus halotolerans]
MENKRHQILYITHQQKFSLLNIAKAKRISSMLNKELSLFYIANTLIGDQINQISKIQECMSECKGNVFYVHESVFEIQMSQALREQQYPFIIGEHSSIQNIKLPEFLKQHECRISYQKIVLPCELILFADERIYSYEILKQKEVILKNLENRISYSFCQ